MTSQRLAIFDLDGTLLKNNSHIDVVSEYRKKRYDSLRYKLVAKLFPSFFVKFLNRQLARVPSCFLDDYQFKLNDDIVDLLRSKQADGFKVIVVSNAPKLILARAERVFDVPCLHAPPNSKSSILEMFTYTSLFVCTDNITDLDLINLSDESVVLTKRKRRHLFPQKANFLIVD